MDELNNKEAAEVTTAEVTTVAPELPTEETTQEVENPVPAAEETAPTETAEQEDNQAD